MSFDLNIENYTTKELSEMFDLPSNYDRNILEKKETKLRESIMNNRELNKEMQTKTINFLVKAKNILINSHPNNQEKNTDLKIHQPNG